MKAKRRKIEFFKQNNGIEPVKEWLTLLKKKNKHIEHGKITSRLNRAQTGNFGDHRFLGKNWGELKIDFGPGYRVYFAIDEDKLILLLHGGTKLKQQTDIELAKKRWAQYLRTKQEHKNEK